MAELFDQLPSNHLHLRSPVFSASEQALLVQGDRAAGMLREILSTNEREDVQRLSGMPTQIDLTDDTISQEGYF